MKRSDKVNFSIQELLDLLEEQAQEGGEGMSTREIAQRCGMSETWVQMRLRELQEAGRLDIAWREGRRLDGARRKTPVYRLKATK